MSKAQKILKNTNHLLMPTLFDRLIDEAPQRKTETIQEMVIDPVALRGIVQRDLGYLFNAMNQHKWINFEKYPEIESSALNYGMSPMSGTYQTKVHWPISCSHIKNIIRYYEPRLTKVQIQSQEQFGQDSRTYNILNFQIIGEINVKPYPIEFVVQSSMDLESTRLLIKSASIR